MDETFEMDGLPVITRGKAPEVFQAVKASFDPVSVSVDARDDIAADRLVEVLSEAVSKDEKEIHARFLGA